MTTLETQPLEEPKPRRMTMGRVVEMLLNRDNADQSAVTLTRNASGDTLIEVKVRAGDEADDDTAETAAGRAQAIYEALREAYPQTAAHENAAVSLTRNAKGETQLEVVQRTGERLRTVAAVTAEAIREYDKLRGRYPMLSGLTAKPGSVATGASPE